MLKAITVSAALAIVLGGSADSCDRRATDSVSDYAAKVCVETASKLRSVQANCDEGKAGFGWQYWAGDTVIPKVGKKVPAKGNALPPDVRTYVRIPDDEGDVTAFYVGTR
jgi:hypothetical protein